MSKENIYNIAEKLNIDKDEFYKRYRLEKKNRLTIFETSKSNLDEFKAVNNTQTFTGLAVCVGNKGKVYNNPSLLIDIECEKVFKEFGLSLTDKQILYLTVLSIRHKLYEDDDEMPDEILNNYILNIPDYGLKCSKCGAPLNFETRQTRSADEGDKTFAVCTKNQDHIFSTDRFTLDSEKQDASKEINMLLDR